MKKRIFVTALSLSLATIPFGSADLRAENTSSLAGNTDVAVAHGLASQAAATPLAVRGAVRAQPLSARVDPRMELFAIVFRLAGNPEYNMVRVPAYDAALDAHFGPHADHPAVEMARSLRAVRGVGYDAVMSLAIHVTDVESLELSAPLESPGLTLDARWPRARIPEFLKRVREFRRDADVAGFLAAQAPFYAELERQMQEVLDQHADVGWFERFFGEAPAGGFEVVLSPAAGGGNYGPRFIAPDGHKTVYAIMGVWQTDEAGLPRIGRHVIPTLVHEFSHSFVNHNVDAHRTELADAGKAIYPLVEPLMKQQAYGTWMTMLYEALVRAATARYVLADQGEEAARRVVLTEQVRGFIAMDELYELLGEYEADRARYPTLASFMPRFVDWLNELAPRAESVRDAFDASRPQVISTQPADGDAGIDAEAIDTIVLKWDRPMAPSLQINPIPGSHGHADPDIHDEEWSDDGLTLVLHVRLRPGSNYGLLFNMPFGGAFRCTAGIPAFMHTLRFSTR